MIILFGECTIMFHNIYAHPPETQYAHPPETQYAHPPEAQYAHPNEILCL